MSLPTVDSDLPSVVPSGSGELTRTEADAIYVEQADATGYDDIYTATEAVADMANMLQAQRATLAYTDTTAKDLFTLPAGAVIIGFVFNVTTQFDDSGTDLIDIGDGTTPDRFVSDYDGETTGIALVASADEAALSAETVVKGLFTGQNSNAANGAMTITCLYIVP
jgi:hypothetical protein